MSIHTGSFPSVTDLKSADRRPQEDFTGIFVLRRSLTRTTKNNNLFLVMEMSDRTGSFTFTCFDDNPLFQELKSWPEGSLLKVIGRVEHYQGRFSPKISAAERLSEEDLQGSSVLEQLVEVSTEDPETLMLELYETIESVQSESLRNLLENVFNEIGPVFKYAPAAMSMHHAYRSGLLEHTMHMARAARVLLPLYPEVDPDLAMTGILVHDIGKTLEYGGELAYHKTRTGILQGHVVLGYRIVRKAGMSVRMPPELLERLEHILLSHQGELEWGAAAMAATPEAVFVSMIDNLDAKMGMVQEALRQARPEEEFTDYLPGLKAPVLRTPLPD